MPVCRRSYCITLRLLASRPYYKRTNQLKKKKIMKKYVCDVCGWIYDPEVGDPDSGIEPGTAFEDIPEDWVCPECGVGKEDFSVVED